MSFIILAQSSFEDFKMKILCIIVLVSWTVALIHALTLFAYIFRVSWNDGYPRSSSESTES